MLHVLFCVSVLIHCPTLYVIWIVVQIFKILMKNVDCHRFYFQFTTLCFLFMISCLVLTSTIFELLITIDLRSFERKFQFHYRHNILDIKVMKRVLIFMFVDHVFIVTNDVRLKGINLVKLVLVQSIQLTTYNIIYRVKTMPW